MLSARFLALFDFFSEQTILNQLILILFFLTASYSYTDTYKEQDQPSF